MMRKCSTKFFKYAEGPVQMKGDGRTLSSSSLSLTTMSAGRMKVHCLSGYISNLYLCEYPDLKRMLLLDTGMGRDVDRVEFFINNVLHPDTTSSSTASADSTPKKKPFDTQLKTVVSTHCHVDHMGAAWGYRERGIPVAVADRYEEYFKGIGGKTQQGIEAVLATFVAHRLGRKVEYPFCPLSVPEGAELDPRLRLKDGSHVPGFEDWVAVACPGHTCHMNMLFHPESHILYAADFFVANNKQKKEFRAPVPIDVDYAYTHSLERLRNLSVRYVLLAHGGIIDCQEAGGWEAILDDVASHRNSQENDNWTMRLIRNTLTGYTSEPSTFDRSRLPSLPLPKAADQPAHISRSKL